MNNEKIKIKNHMFFRNQNQNTPDNSAVKLKRPQISSMVFQNYIKNKNTPQKNYTNLFKGNRTLSFFKFHFNNRTEKKEKRVNTLGNVSPKIKIISNKGYSVISTEANSKRKKKLCLNTIERIKLKSILKNFKNNKIMTNELFSLDKKFPLNSITTSNYIFLILNDKKRRRNINNNVNITKSSLLSLNMIKKFNLKTKGLLDVDSNNEEGIKFSKNINVFRKQIINSYNDQIKPKDVKKRKIVYNKAIFCLENNYENKIKKAQELEKEFYKVKYYMDQYLIDDQLIKTKDNNSSKKDNSSKDDTDIAYSHKNISMKNKIATDPRIKKQSRNKILNNIQPLNLKKNEKKKIFFETDSILKDIKEKHRKYEKKLIKERSKQYAISLAGINNYFEYQPLEYINSDLPGANINEINLKRVIKVNSINKNLFASDDDVLLQHNIKKLKEEIRNVEVEYYTVDNKKQYKLSFVKNQVKPKTIDKLNNMRNPHFGVPC